MMFKGKWSRPHKPILENTTIAHIIAYQTKAGITQMFNAILREQPKTHGQKSCQPGSVYVVSVECFNNFSRSPLESIRTFLTKRRENKR